MARTTRYAHAKAARALRAVRTLIGWGLGGLYARELAKLLKPQVRQVITIGTPFKATVDQTNVGWLYRLLSGAGAAADPKLSKRLRTLRPVPTLSIYSRTDGVVPWQTCCHDKKSPLLEDVEISGSHMGMGWNPAVLRVSASNWPGAPRGRRISAPGLSTDLFCNNRAPLARPLSTPVAASDQR